MKYINYPINRWTLENDRTDKELVLTVLRSYCRQKYGTQEYADLISAMIDRNIIRLPNLRSWFIPHRLVNVSHISMCDFLMRPYTYEADRIDSLKTGKFDPSFNVSDAILLFRDLSSLGTSDIYIYDLLLYLYVLYHKTKDTNAIAMFTRFLASQLEQPEYIQYSKLHICIGDIGFLMKQIVDWNGKSIEERREKQPYYLKLTQKMWDEFIMAVKKGLDLKRTEEQFRENAVITYYRTRFESADNFEEALKCFKNDGSSSLCAPWVIKTDINPNDNFLPKDELTLAYSKNKRAFNSMIDFKIVDYDKLPERLEQPFSETWIDVIDLKDYCVLNELNEVDTMKEVFFMAATVELVHNVVLTEITDNGPKPLYIILKNADIDNYKLVSECPFDAWIDELRSTYMEDIRYYIDKI